PIDLGGAAFRPIAEVRDAGAGLGIRWWPIPPFASDDPAAVTERTTAPPDQASPPARQTTWNDAGRATPKASGPEPAEPDDLDLLDETGGRGSYPLGGRPAAPYPRDTARGVSAGRGGRAGGGGGGARTRGPGAGARRGAG